MGAPAETSASPKQMRDSQRSETHRPKSLTNLSKPITIHVNGGGPGVQRILRLITGKGQVSKSPQGGMAQATKGVLSQLEQSSGRGTSPQRSIEQILRQAIGHGR